MGNPAVVDQEIFYSSSLSHSNLRLCHLFTRKRKEERMDERGFAHKKIKKREREKGKELHFQVTRKNKR